MKKEEIQIKFTVYDSLETLNNSDRQLVEQARQAALKAYSPYSTFKVGAALRLENGKIFSANNQENAAYPSGLCAERVALFYANANFPDQAVTEMAITAFADDEFLQQPVPPCGSCRQALLETEKRFNQKIRIIMAGTKKINVIDNAYQLLPLNFSSEMFISKKQTK